MRRVLLSLLALLLTAVAVPALPVPARAVVAGTITGAVTVPAGYDVRAVQVLVTSTADPTGISPGNGTWVRRTARSRSPGWPRARTTSPSAPTGRT